MRTCANEYPKDLFLGKQGSDKAKVPIITEIERD
jgi:hypothetical protein